MRYYFHNRPILPALLLRVAIVSIALVVAGCSEEADRVAVDQPAEPAEGFTFLNLGRDTVLTKTVRIRLRESLGSEAVEQRTTLNLEPDAPGLLQTLFPNLHALNKQLNYLPRQRIEHDTVKLRYRYAARKKVPFKYVELVFSNYPNRPLVFIIRAGEEGAAILDSLKDKYGDPQRREDGVPGSPVLYWQNGPDYLVMTSGKDNFGHTTYQFSFYFGDNLQVLVDTEVEERKQAAERIQKAGKQAF